MNGAERVAFVNARLVDLASGVDGPGALLVEGRHIADLGPRLFADGVPEGVKTVDCRGDVLAPGLVDMRVTVPETSETHKENLVSAAQAASCASAGNPAMRSMSGLERSRRNRVDCSALSKVKGTVNHSPRTSSKPAAATESTGCWWWMRRAPRAARD